MNPILDPIKKLDGQVKIYALNGMAMAFANEIEDTMFWSYMAASGQSFEDAITHFYRHANFKPKMVATNTAICKKTENTPDLRIWEALNQRIQDLLGEDNNLRNLIGHNRVSANIYIPAEKSLDEEVTDIEIRHEVQQKVAMVAFRGRLKTTAGEVELADYCDNLFNLYIDLESFADKVLQFGSMHPTRYGLDMGRSPVES